MDNHNNIEGPFRPQDLSLREPASMVTPQLLPLPVSVDAIDQLSLASTTPKCVASNNCEHDKSRPPTPIPFILKTKLQQCNHPDCKKKLSLMDQTMACRCKHVFCSSHRYACEHRCTFDFKATTVALLEQQNQKIVADKVERI